MTGSPNAHWGAGAAPGAQNPPPPPPRPRSAVERFLGGSPLGVVLRLLLLSLVVGALVSRFGIRPQDILLGVEAFARRIWSLGFEALRDVGDYLIAGALVVVPVWFVLRLLDMRRGS